MDSHETSELKADGEAAEPRRTRKMSRLARAAAALAVLALGALAIWYLMPVDSEAPPEEPLAPVAVSERQVEPPELPRPEPTFSVPVGLRIPSIGVDAPVVRVGITDDGVMEAPEGPVDTGWYERGPRPGERGSAVIAGHSGYRTGPAVFDDLGQLEPGDFIYVVDEQGAQIAFTVRESREYRYYESPPEVFSRNDGHHLNLVTCTGAWDASAGTSSKRLVVFADAVLD